LTPPVDVTDDQPRTVDMLADEGTRMLDTLQSDTARTILATLREEPATTSSVADQVETTLQNVHYHMEQLEAAGLVRAVSTHYSSRGVEMDVFAVDGAPLMLVCGDDEQITAIDAAADSRRDDQQPAVPARSD
jgi:DNA-binding transcriptional ArsR family regulator